MKTPTILPKTCKSSLVLAKNYNLQELEDNMWLIIISDPLIITIKCRNQEANTQIINKTSILQLTINCNAYVGNTKVQPKLNQGSEIESTFHTVTIPYDCCQHLPDNVKTKLNLQPLKLNKFNTENLDIANHKLEQYSRDLDNIINEPFVKKHISWFTYFIIILIVILILLYIFCKCKNRRSLRIAIQNSGNQPPRPPKNNKTIRQFVKFLPQRRPSIGIQEDYEEDMELNTNDFSKNYA